jgi:ABC-type sugar transport system ATPase subunit
MIICRNLSKTYVAPDQRTVTALSDVSLTINQGEFFVLLGPSGSGKTTTLRSIAGLEQPNQGEILIDDRVVLSTAKSIRVPPEERPIAMVFQSYALWPHMDVTGNIAFPLRSGIRRVARQEVTRRVEKALDLLHLRPQANRSVGTLSGGQQQRVALARAIALEPSVLLMDEPLSNLDARLRATLRIELKDLTRAIGITTVYVTHDQTEAMVMGDRIAVMNHGTILQEGSPQDLYQRPASLFVAKFLGEMNFLAGKIEMIEGQFARVATSAGPLVAVRSAEAPAQGPVVVGIRLEDASLAQGPGENVIRARVTARHYLGDSFLYEMQSGAQPLQIRLPKQTQLELATDVFLAFPREACIAFRGDAETKTNP